MEDIEYNIKLRKLYSSKLCEFYNYIKEKINLQNKFNFPFINLLNEEKVLLNKLQSKKQKITSFNNEIDLLLKSNITLSNNKNNEINYLKKSFENQYQDISNQYTSLLKNMEKNRNDWLNEIIYEFIQHSNKQKYLIELSNKLDDAFPKFQKLCESWNLSSLDKAKQTLLKISEIELFCNKLLQKFDDLLNSNDDLMLNNNSLSQQCEQLSILLELFFKNFNIIELLNKLNNNDIILFKNEFKELLGSNGFGQIRSTIKLVHNINATKNRIEIIYNTFKKLQIIIYPEFNKLQDKKTKLLSLCCNSSEINRITTEKWVLDNYIEIFKPIDDILNN